MRRKLRPPAAAGSATIFRRPRREDESGLWSFFLRCRLRRNLDVYDVLDANFEFWKEIETEMRGVFPSRKCALLWIDVEYLSQKSNQARYKFAHLLKKT